MNKTATEILMERRVQKWWEDKLMTTSQIEQKAEQNFEHQKLLTQLTFSLMYTAGVAKIQQEIEDNLSPDEYRALLKRAQAELRDGKYPKEFK